MEIMARGDAARPTRNVQRYSQVIFFAPENVLCASEDKDIIKTAFVAVGVVWRSRQGHVVPLWLCRAQRCSSGNCCWGKSDGGI